MHYIPRPIRILWAALKAFAVIYFGALIVAPEVTALLFGPYRAEGPLGIARTVVDQSISMLFCVLAGYAAAYTAPLFKSAAAYVGAIGYFVLSFSWYLGYEMDLARRLVAVVSLVKVPVGVALGLCLYRYYHASAQNDGADNPEPSLSLNRVGPPS